MIGGITAPGVYTTERDWSAYIPALSTTQFGIVTTASKGPVDQIVHIGSLEQLLNVFGPLGTHAGLLAGAQYLRNGNLLQVVRVAGYSEATAVQNSQDAVVTFTPTSSGSWANSPNGLELIITSDPYNVGRKNIQVKWRGYTVERFNSVNFTRDSDDFIDTRMAKSKYVTATYHSGNLSNGTISFTGGDDGAVGLTSSDVIGAVVGTRKTGLELFRSPYDTDINLLAVPGNSHAEVVNQLIAIAEERQDCMSLIDPPFGLDVDGVIQWHNGFGSEPNSPTSALNSNYASLSWPWLKVYDSFLDAYVWAPPSGFVASQMALTDRDYALWFATAGFNRGRIVGALDSEYSPNDGERARLCGRVDPVGFNAVNPFVKFTNQGIVRFDCLTLQRAPTALNLEPVRRMLTYLRKVIATAMYTLLFEPNDYRLWARFKSMVIPYLQSVKNRQGLRDFLVIMDETTNTDDVIEQGICSGRIFLKPVKPARIIHIEFTLTAQGTNFQELVTKA